MKSVLKVFGVLAILFGIATVVSGGKVIFGGEEAYRAAGNVIPFVLWFNFVAGFVYTITGAAILLNRSEARFLSYTLAIASVLVYLGFWYAVYSGVPHEFRTAVAMGVRTGFWVVLSLLILMHRNQRLITDPSDAS